MISVNTHLVAPARAHVQTDAPVTIDYAGEIHKAVTFVRTYEDILARRWQEYGGRWVLEKAQLRNLRYLSAVVEHEWISIIEAVFNLFPVKPCHQAR